MWRNGRVYCPRRDHPEHVRVASSDSRNARAEERAAQERSVTWRPVLDNTQNWKWAVDAEWSADPLDAAFRRSGPPRSAL